MTDFSKNKDYQQFLQEVKQRIQKAQLKAASAVNAQLVSFYWEMGRYILEQQEQKVWGAKVVEQLSKDLKKAFPKTQGFSRRNLFYMQKFAKAYPDFKLVQAALAQISWYHHIALMSKCKDLNERVWYAQKTVEGGWSRDVMVLQIESGLYGRQGQLSTNFQQTLPNIQSELAQQTLKDPYVFDFLNIEEVKKEKDLEDALVKNITKFLLELGNGFAFVGQQYPLRVGQKDYFIDLLFYHIDLECYVAIELKIGEFKPEYAGKIGFYLSVLDDRLRKPHQKPSVGIILCKSRDKVVAEYALRQVSNPVGISDFQLVREIPEKLQKSLPPIQALEEELERLKNEKD